MLGRKQNIKNEEWLAAVASIEETVSQQEIDELTAATINEIQKRIGENKAAYAWSGGKDSIVLGHICEQAGVSASLIGVCNLEYPAFMRWIEDNKPDCCEVINTGQDLEWLATHQWMLFPENSGVAARWFAIVQHAAQRKYFQEHEVNILLLGRRKADGNFVGRGDNIYTDGKGVTRYSPLADWRHEDILAYIHYHRLPLPPIYGWQNGYKCGTHPWPARQWTKGNGWAEAYAIDPSIVEEAAEHIPAAADYLKEVGDRG